jgi:predicted phosphodiesterase
MKLALVTDTHAGIRGDSDTFAEYQERFWYEQFFPYLEEHGITSIVHLGDVTDRRKWVSYKTLHRFKQVMDKMRFEYDLSIIIGNHDTYYKNTNRVNSMDCLFDNGIDVYDEVAEATFDGLDVLIVPWINSDNEKNTLKRIKESKSTVCFGHLNLAGFPFAKGIVSTDGMNKGVFRKFDMVFSGHFHTRSHADNIWYLGSPFEQTWIDYGEARGFHVFDTETLELEFVPNPHKMFSKVFYDADVEDEFLKNKIDFDTYKRNAVKVVANEINDQYIFDKFIVEMEAADPWHLQIIDNTDAASRDDIEIEHIESKGTLELLNDYVEQTQYDNKDDVKGLMKSLFEEAISNA